jgi:hypothetical protein
LTVATITNRIGVADSPVTASSERGRPLETGRSELQLEQELPRSDPDRALVMRMVRSLVESGVAEWTVLDSGDIRLGLASGEIFNLGQDCATRIR